MQTAQWEAIYRRQVKTVYRVCFACMKNHPDTEDAVQDVFVKLARANKQFLSEEHEKAWLIRVAGNLCKDRFRRQKPEPLQENISGSDRHDETLQAVLELPEKYKIAVYLYYYEGYSGDEIAHMLRKPASTVRSHLQEARQLLRERLGDFE